MFAPFRRRVIKGRILLLRVALPLCLTALFTIGAASHGVAAGESRADRQAVGARGPRVFIVCGAPGDDRHDEAFRNRLDRLREWFTGPAGIPSADVGVWYGSEREGYAGEGTRTALEIICADIVRQTKAGHPVWLVITGHANAAPGDVRFNLRGTDVSGADLARWLTGAAEGDGAAPLSIILATSCSGRAVRHLSAHGRAIMAATNATEPDDEPVFGDSLVEAIEDPRTDADGDGVVSLTEMFLAARAAVRARYEHGGFVLTEHASLDGDGDGRATQRPAEADASAASRAGHSLPLITDDAS